MTPSVDQAPPAQSVLIVIPCLNERHMLPDVVASILADDGVKSASIVVVDGGSTDGTLEWAHGAALKNPRLLVLENPRRLQSAAVNLAADRYGRDVEWLARVDAHCRYPSNFVSGLIATAVQQDADAVATPMVTEASGCFQRAVAAAQNSRLGTGGSAHRHAGGGGWIDHGHHALISMQRFLVLGGYDESFAANEDAEFDMRFTRAGGRIWLSGERPIVYYPRKTAAALFRQYLKYGVGRSHTLLLHRARPRVRQTLPLVVAPAVLLLLISPLLWPLAIPALAWAGVCLTYGAVIAVRSKDMCALGSGLAAMIMHFAWSLGFLSGVGRPWTAGKSANGSRATPQ